MHRKIATLQPSDIEQGTFRSVKNFLKRNKAAVYTPLEGYKTYRGLPIHFAAMCGKKKIMGWLLKEAPDLIDIKDDYGQTPLSLATTYDHPQVVKDLLKKGANFNIPVDLPHHDKYGYLPIHFAAHYGYTHLIQIFLAFDVDIHATTGEYGMSVMHIAAKYGQLDVMQCLLAHNLQRIHFELFDQIYLLEIAASHKQQAIIEFLLDTAPSKNPWELTLIALRSHNLDMMKYLIARYPKIQNIKNMNGETLLMMAVRYQNQEFIKYLLTQAINLDEISDRKGHWSYGKTALEQAIQSKLDHIAYTIILKKTENQPRATILPFIVNIDMVLFFLAQDASFFDLFISDKHIEALIMDYLKNTGQKTIDIYHSQTTSRRPSFFERFEPTSGQSSVFYPRKLLGRGFFGVVRLFESTQGEKIAVKSSCIIEDDQTIIQKQTVRQNRENKINAIAYPHHASAPLFYFHTKKEDSTCTTVEYRQILPYLKGERALDVMNRTCNLDQLARLILCIAKELQRLHDSGIIHGDFHLENVLIDIKSDREIISSSVDFGASKLNTDEDSSYYVGQSNTYRPPELRAARIEKIKPSCHQDIYSFGYILKDYLGERNDAQKINYLFPSILTFITASQHADPEQRPSLASFCTALEKELHAHGSDQNIPCLPLNKKRKLPLLFSKENKEEHTVEEISSNRIKNVLDYFAGSR